MTVRCRPNCATHWPACFRRIFETGRLQATKLGLGDKMTTLGGALVFLAGILIGIS
jgi:hypothetical protein